MNNFLVIIGSRNNERWVESNLNSVLSQDYPNYRIIYYDDASDDDTRVRAESILNKDPRHFFSSSSVRKYKTWFFANLEKMVRIEDKDILVFLDGDDMLACENVLTYLNTIYTTTNCWMTYGGMSVWEGEDKVSQPFPQNSEIPAAVQTARAFRKDAWRTSHLKTMRGFLWKSFDKSDLRYEGNYIVGPDDLAIMFAMLEMTPANKVYRVTEPIYLYNHTQENNTSRTYGEHKETGVNYEEHIRRLKPHQQLPIICPTLMGGLGNQMFEVAVAASLAKDNNAVLVVNPTEHILPNQGRNINNYLENVFGKVIADPNPIIENTYDWEPPVYSPIPYRPNLKIKTHGQSFHYFEGNEKYILDLFGPSPATVQRISQKYNLEKAAMVTALQVRRGDYAKFPDTHPLLPVEYYAKAVKLAEPTELWVFSDDIEWCKENLHFNCPVQYIKDEDYIELYLMSFCKNVIMSNSSFGWWAGYLNQQGGKIYAPRVWFGPTLVNQGFQHKDLIPSNWVVIDA